MYGRYGRVICKWCGDRPGGCTFCPAERAKWAEEQERRRMEPIITARMDNPKEMAELNQVAGREAIEHAFGPNGGGMAEIEFNAAKVDLVRALRKVVSEDAAEKVAEQAMRDPRKEGVATKRNV